MNSKRIVIVAIVILIAIAVGSLLYFGLLAPKAGTPGGAAAGQTGTLPAAGNQTNSPAAGTSGANSGGSSAGSDATVNLQLAKNFGVISNEPVLDYFVTASNTVFAVEPDGKVIQVVGGNTTVLSQLAIQDVVSASFAFDGSRLLVNFGDPTNPQTSVFNLGTKAWAPMPAGWRSPVWSPTDFRILYGIVNANGTETLATADARQAKPKPVIMTTLHAQDLALAWPNKNKIALFMKPSAYAAGSAWLFDLGQLSLTPIATERSGLTVSFGKNKALTFSAGTSGFGGHLELVDLTSAVTQRITFLTLPSKCGFGGAATSTVSYLYCAVPRDENKLSFSRLPDDYNQMTLFTADNIYRIGLASGTIDTVFIDQSQVVDASDVTIANNTVFFVNRYDKKLYALQLGL